MNDWCAALRTGVIVHHGNPASENTVENYQMGMYYLWKYSGKEKILQNLTTQTVESAIHAIPLDREKENCGYSKKKAIYAATKSLIKFLNREGITHGVEIEKVKPPKRAFKAKRTIVRSNEFDQLVTTNECMAGARETREFTKTLLYLMGYAGLRKEEGLIVAYQGKDPDKENLTEDRERLLEEEFKKFYEWKQQQKEI